MFLVLKKKIDELTLRFDKASTCISDEMKSINTSINRVNTNITSMYTGIRNLVGNAISWVSEFVLESPVSRNVNLLKDTNRLSIKNVTHPRNIERIEHRKLNRREIRREIINRNRILYHNRDTFLLNDEKSHSVAREGKIIEEFLVYFNNEKQYNVKYTGIHYVVDINGVDYIIDFENEGEVITEIYIDDHVSEILSQEHKDKLKSLNIKYKE